LVAGGRALATVFPSLTGPRGVGFAVAGVSRAPSAGSGAGGGHGAPVLPVDPGGVGVGSSSSGGVSAGGFGGPGALLFGLLALAFGACYRLLLLPAAFRPLALISLVERPG
jgi:hypothetical protein